MSSNLKSKRICDFFLALMGMIVLFPAFLLIGIIIKLATPGPIYYRAKRAGMNGKPFVLYKFRTMIVGADQYGSGITTRDEPRVTSVGRFLRATKLDELPQLINVIKGDMSLVGPRPEDPRYVETYTQEQRRVLQVRPGITSWASIQYRNEEELLMLATVEDTYRDVILPRKLALDLQYIDQRSCYLDFRILILTFFALFVPGVKPEKSVPSK